jgi:hypothetical protein
MSGFCQRSNELPDVMTMVTRLPAIDDPRQTDSNDTDYHPVQHYTNLRTLLFGTDLGELAERRADTIDRVWGVVMEAGYPEAAVTLLALADGTVSIYLSTGGGLTGLGDYEHIHNASQRLIRLAAEFSVACERMREFPLPRKGHTRIYLLTYTGPVGLDVDESDVGREFGAAPLFERGHELMAMIRNFGEQLALERSGHRTGTPASH